jgi:hypothetical protein
VRADQDQTDEAGAEARLAKLQRNTIPIEPIGTDRDIDGGTGDYAALYPEPPD